MSYTLVIKPTSKDDALDAIDLAHVNSDEGRTPEMQEQIAALKAVLPSLLPVVGGPDAVVHIEISGHANPGREYDGERAPDEKGTERFVQPDEVIYLTIRASRP